MFGWLKRLFGPNDDELLDSLGFGPNSVRIYSTNNVDQDHFDLVAPLISSDASERLGVASWGDVAFRVKTNDLTYLVLAETGADYGMGGALIVKSVDLVNNVDDERSLLDSMDLIR